MSASTVESTYTIKEAAALTGLPASTLRYYESMGVFAAVERGYTSGHRVYSEADMHVLMSVSCLNAIGMSVSDIAKYVANGALGPEAAPEQLAMLRAQRQRLAQEAKQIAVRRRYVEIKLEYWNAIEAGDSARAAELSAEARALAGQLKTTRPKA